MHCHARGRASVRYQQEAERIEMRFGKTRWKIRRASNLAFVIVQRAGLGRTGFDSRLDSPIPVLA